MTTSDPQATPTPVDPAGEVTLRQRLTSFNPWWLAIAATLLLALWGWREFGIRVARENAKSQEAEINRLEVENDRLVRQLEKVTTELGALASAHVDTVTLAGQPASPNATGKVFLDMKERRAVAFFYNFPASPAGQQYRFWVMSPTGRMDGGSFVVPRSGRASIAVEGMPADAQSFIVTLGDGEEQYVSGTIAAPAPGS